MEAWEVKQEIEDAYAYNSGDVIISPGARAANLGLNESDESAEDLGGDYPAVEDEDEYEYEGHLHLREQDTAISSSSSSTRPISTSTNTSIRAANAYDNVDSFRGVVSSIAQREVRLAQIASHERRARVALWAAALAGPFRGWTMSGDPSHDLKLFNENTDDNPDAINETFPDEKVIGQALEYVYGLLEWGRVTTKDADGNDQSNAPLSHNIHAWYFVAEELAATRSTILNAARVDDHRTELGYSYDFAKVSISQLIPTGAMLYVNT